MHDDRAFFREPSLEGTSAFHEHLRRAPSTLCLYPVSHVNFKNNGDLSCCFRAVPLENMNQQEVEAYWNSEKLRTIRKNMVNGIKSPECSACWKVEESGGFSYRTESLSDWGIHKQWRNQFDLLTADGSMPFQVKQAELRFSNVCNLQCRMCSPMYSTKWESDMKQGTEVWKWLDKNGYYSGMQKNFHEDVSASKMLEFIEKSAPHLEYLMITGGEPFIDTSHTEALRLLKPYAKNITLEYTTNLNTLTASGRNVLDLWEDFKQIRLKVSIDGDPENYNYVRHGGNIQAVIDNAKKIYERYPITNEKPNSIFPEEKVVIHGTCTVSAYNIARLDKIANFITSIGALFHTSQVHYPPFQSSCVLPKEVKKKITQNLQRYLVLLEDEMDWGDHPMWASPELRTLQLRRIYRFVRNSFVNMNSKDTEDHYFRRFIEFEKAFNRSKGVSDADFEHFLEISHLKEAAAKI